MSDDLSEYRRKRDFRKTPEPSARTGSRATRATSEAQVFVVHRHEATHVHYDLRLESGGVLKSWAVPRGFSYSREDKRLAVRTEDHPIEYVDFDGVIPEGEYGAGTMTIWDKGVYRVLEGGTVEEGADAGKLVVEFDGERLRGEWHLVRTSRNPKEWLLIKGRDVYERDADDPPYPFGVDFGRAPAREFPRRLVPMEPEATTPPFTDHEWLFEIEFAGMRVSALKRGEDVRLRDSSGRAVEGKTDSVLASLRKLRARTAALDGVLVCLDDDSRPSRARLERRLAEDTGDELTLCAFDIVQYDRWNVEKLTLYERRQILRSIVPRSRAISFVESVRAEGGSFARSVATAGLGGVIAKCAASPYVHGTSPTWRRIELPGREPISGSALDVLRAASGTRKSEFGRVRFTHRQKIYFPSRGCTKGDLLDYYHDVADALLPHLRGRPCHLRRFPDGIDGKSFYHHNLPDTAPVWVRTETVIDADGEPVRYPVCDDRETLAYLVNLGSIDLHPWLSSVGSLDVPDWIVFDLDPNGAEFSLVVRVAQRVGRVLRGIGLRPYVKTSGASGVHVFVPLVARYSYEQTRMFAEGVARHIASERSDLCTVERVKARRGGKVYIDYLQNRRGQTVVPPYVVRPVEAATVSAPLEWDELDSKLRREDFSLETMARRIAHRGELFAAVLTDRQELEPAIHRFSEMLGR